MLTVLSAIFLSCTHNHIHLVSGLFQKLLFGHQYVWVLQSDLCSNIIDTLLIFCKLPFRITTMHKFWLGLGYTEMFHLDKESMENKSYITDQETGHPSKHLVVCLKPCKYTQGYRLPVICTDCASYINTTTLSIQLHVPLQAT